MKGTRINKKWLSFGIFRNL